MKGTELYIHAGIFGACVIFFVVAALCYARRKSFPDLPPPLDKGTVPTQGFGLVDVAGVMIFLMFYATGLFVAQGEVDLSPGSLVIAFFFQIFMAAVVVGILFWRINLMSLWGVVWERWWLAILAIPTVFIIWSLMAVLDGIGYNEWIAEIVGKKETTQEMVLALQEEKDPVVLALLSIVAVIGAPLSEEIIFRGYIYPATKRFAGMGLAVVFSGAIFAVVHMNLAALLPLFLLGMVLAVLYEATGSLWMPIAVHFVFNLGTVVVQNLMRIRPDLFEEAQKAAGLCL